MGTTDPKPSRDFIRTVIDKDLAEKTVDGIVTRFPPEPNGYLHIGHAKAININFGIAREFGGRFHLRFDDTNPVKEDTEYIEAIKRDIQWLGCDWGEHLYFASDYFQQMYEYAVSLVKQGKAYVDDLTAEEIKEYRGTLTEAGKESPYRNRSIEENLELFEQMKQGELDEGSCVLRAKIDMASPNMNLRDPAVYRIKKAHHHRTGDKWCIYPMYDFAHGIEDATEMITHSLCSLEFQNHRPLYDWFLDQLDVPCHPKQMEFARLRLNYTVLSKRKLLKLVQEGLVSGWDDPRMPTLSGLRRRGYTAEAISAFCEAIGISKENSVVDIGMLEAAIRSDLNTSTKRVMGVLRPLKVVITNYPDGETEEFDAPYFPDDPPKMGSRKVPFSKEIYIEHADFMEDPPRKFFRLSPGKEVRLRRAYYITCNDVIKDETTGEILELHCTYDPKTRGGWSDDGRKVKGTLHWASATHAIKARVHLYDRLFTDPTPDGHKEQDFVDFLNPKSVETLEDCLLEPCMKDAKPGERFQFERLGYFCVDTENSAPGALVMNRIVPLRDSWAKIAKQQQQQQQKKGKKRPT